MSATTQPNWQRSTRCGGGDCVEVAWRKSSRSSATTCCVEVAEQPGTVLVRDSKDPGGPRLTFAAGSWTAFLAAIRAGDFER